MRRQAIAIKKGDLIKLLGDYDIAFCPKYSSFKRKAIIKDPKGTVLYWTPEGLQADGVVMIAVKIPGLKKKLRGEMRAFDKFRDKDK